MVYRTYVKRFLDIVLSLILLIVCSPILIVTAILVRIKLGSPVIFVQERAGYRNRMFNLYKFRSMTSERDEHGNLLPDEMRLTRFGAALRATSLDELPEIFNIIKGDMSLIGPRPLLPEYVDLYSPRQRKRHTVKPGLTGLAQVNGRNAIIWEEKFEWDLEYAERVSFRLDLAIFFRTIGAVLHRTGITGKNEATTAMFGGTKKVRFGSKHKQEIRILFTSAGNKVELIQTFLYAAGNLGVDVVTCGSDVSLGYPAMLKCRYAFRVGFPKEEGYVEQILDVCRKNRIHLVVPLSEDDRILASYEKLFAENGTRLLISSPDVTNLCMNKKRVIDYFASCGVRTCRPVDNVMDYDGGYPAVIELSDDGRGVYSYRVENEKELQYYIMRCQSYLLRPYMEGDTYEVSVFCDFHGNPIYITPMVREAVQGKEIARYGIVQDEMMIRETKVLLDVLKPVGPLTISVIKEKATGRNFFVGMRPFFSENVPISIKAGADSPLAVLKLMCGAKVGYQPNAADDGVTFSRVEQVVMVRREQADLRTFRKFEELYQLDDDIEAVIFDLDDVLYSQKEFMRSGYRAIAEEFPQIHNAYNRMCAIFEQGRLPIDTILEEEGMDDAATKKLCLDIMVAHEPDIKLYPGVEELFRMLRKQKKFIAVVTDGKPLQQRNKINALRLKYLVDEVLITDELAGNGDVHEFRKPNDIAYLIIRKRLGVALRNMAYVGVDEKRDFQTPQKLGMKCYQYINEDRLYAEVEPMQKDEPTQEVDPQQ